jgi:hypothetical protein
MPKKPAVLAPLSELYQTALNSCFAVWPILLIRVVYLFLCLMFVLGGTLICFMPLFRNVFDRWNDLGEGNLKSWMSEIDWMSYFGDFHNLLMAALLTAIGITLGGFFWAFFDAAVYSEIHRNQKTGKVFSLRSFFEGGIQKMIPMVGLKCAWILVALGMVFVLSFIGVLGAFIGKFLPWWIDLLLALPAGLIMVFISVVILTALSLSAAFLVDGHGIWDSIKAGIDRAVQHKGRAMWAVLLLGLAYMIFFLAFTGVFTVLAMIPLIGILFGIFKFFVTSILAIGINIYMSSLSVAIQLEPKEVR